MSCERQYSNENKQKKNVLHTFCEVMAVLGLFVFLIIGCAMFRKAEDRRFEESSMFSVVEDNSYWTIYYHKGTKVMWIRNKGGRETNFEMLVDENGNPMIWGNNLRMNLIEKWKNRETKKKLREENIRLKAQLGANLKSSFPVVTISHNMQKVKFSMEVNQMDLERGIPTEYIKRSIVNGISEYIEPFIEYNFCDSTEYGGKIYTGTLFVATGDKKYE